MSERNPTLRDDALNGTGFSPSPEPEQTQRASAPEGKPPLRPEDFYTEGPYVVFTAAYHLRRGYCCNSGCRHCPYN